MAQSYNYVSMASSLTKNMSRHGVKKGHGDKYMIRSIGSERTCRSVLRNLGKWLWQKGIRLENATHKDITRFIEYKSNYVCQKTLDRYSMILGRFCRNRFKHVTSKVETVKPRGRAYVHKWAAKLLESCACARMAISIALCYFCGLRAIELCNIARLEEQPRSPRDWYDNLFIFSDEWVPYTVKGKGGLIRMVAVPKVLSEMLEKFRREDVVRITDREIHHISRYDIPCGKIFSARMAKLSKKYFGISNGAHGLRYSYTQRRLVKLVAEGVPFSTARSIVTQEIGHFSDSNIRYYLVGSPFEVFLKQGGRYELKNCTEAQICILAKDYWICSWTGVDILGYMYTRFVANSFFP